MDHLSYQLKIRSLVENSPQVKNLENQGNPDLQRNSTHLLKIKTKTNFLFSKNKEVDNNLIRINKTWRYGCKGKKKNWTYLLIIYQCLLSLVKSIGLIGNRNLMIIIVKI
jgi:hypothetical protein